MGSSNRPSLYGTMVSRKTMAVIGLEELRAQRWEQNSKARTVGKEKSWKAPVTITEFEAPNSFAFEMRIPLIGGADWSFDIESTDSGCKVTQTWIDQRTKALEVIGGKQAEFRKASCTHACQCRPPLTISLTSSKL